MEPILSLGGARGARHIRHVLCHAVPRGPRTDSRDESLHPQKAHVCIPPYRLDVVRVEDERSDGLPDAVESALRREKIPAAGLASFGGADDVVGVRWARIVERVGGAAPAVD